MITTISRSFAVAIDLYYKEVFYVIFSTFQKRCCLMTEGVTGMDRLVVFVDASRVYAPLLPGYWGWEEMGWVVKDGVGIDAGDEQ